MGNTDLPTILSAVLREYYSRKNKPKIIFLFTKPTTLHKISRQAIIDYEGETLEMAMF